MTHEDLGYGRRRLRFQMDSPSVIKNGLKLLFRCLLLCLELFLCLRFSTFTLARLDHDERMSAVNRLVANFRCV